MFPALALHSHTTNPIGLAAGAYIRWLNENRAALALRGLTVLARVNNWGGSIIRLDGRRYLDGSWLLDQGLRHGLAFQGLRVACQWENVENIRPSMAFLARARGSPSLGAGAACRFKQKNPSGMAHADIRISCRAQNPHGVSASRTTDNMRRFDGSYQFDGSRKWNAKIERSDL